MATSVFNANMSRCIDLVSWPTAKWRSDYTGHVSYWNDSSSENNQGVFFIWFDISAIQAALSGQRVTKVRIKMARQAGTGNANTLAIPFYPQNLNRTTYGVNRTTTLPNSQAVDPQNAQPYFYYSNGSLGTVSLTYNASNDDYKWSTDVTGATAEAVGEAFKDGTYTGFTLYWPYQDNAHYCKLRGYDNANIPQIEFTYEPLNTAPYWDAGDVVTVSPSGTIQENTTSIDVSWPAAHDAEGDTLYYDVYRIVNGVSTKIDDGITFRAITDNIGAGNEGYTYKYEVRVRDASLYASNDPIQSSVVTKNLLTAATLASATSILFATSVVAFTWSGANNTNGNSTFTYKILSDDITIYNPTVAVTSPYNMPIWRTGDSVPAGPYVKFDDIKTFLASAQYHGNIVFKLSTTNAYSTVKYTTKTIAVDIRTNPTGLANLAYSNGYLYSGTTWYLPDQRAIGLGWTAAADPLGTTPVYYDVYYKLSTDSGWTLAQSDLVTTSTTISPPSGATQKTYNVKVVAKSTYGYTQEANAANILIDKYLRPILRVTSKTRTSTNIHIVVAIDRQSTISNATLIGLFSMYYKNKVGTPVSVSVVYSDTTKTFDYTILITDSYLMEIGIQDNFCNTFSLAAVTTNVQVSAYTPMFSIRKNGTATNAINDGTGNYKHIIAGKMNSTPDADGYVGYFKNGVEIGVGATDHGALTGLGDDDHTQYHTDTRGDARYPLKSLITAANDFIIGSGAGAFVKKTLAEIQTLLGLSNYILHSLATATNDFLVASGSGVFVKKTLAEAQALLVTRGTINSVMDYRRQDNVTNSVLSNQRIQSGWGYIVGSGTVKAEEAVIFPVAFDSVPILIVSVVQAAKATANGAPTGPGDTNLDNTNLMAASFTDLTASGFTVQVFRVNSAQTLNASYNYIYTWIAIGSDA